MVNEVYPRTELTARVLGIAERISSNPPTAVQAVKRAVLVGERANKGGSRDHDGGKLAFSGCEATERLCGYNTLLSFAHG